MKVQSGSNGHSWQDATVSIVQAGMTRIVDEGFRGAAADGVMGGTPLYASAARVAQALLPPLPDYRPWWLEVGPAAFALTADRDIVLSLAGAARVVQVGDRIVARGQPIGILRAALHKGDSLRLGPAVTGFCTQVAFAARWGGGRVFDSAATLAGYPDLGANGRYLCAEDKLRMDVVAASHHTDGLRVAYAWRMPTELDEPSGRLRFLPGPEYDAVIASQGLNGARKGSTRVKATVSSLFDAQGIRLQVGSALASDFPSLDDSTPTVLGLIQWPPGGAPVVLGPARQTVGGYPRFGVIISADLMRLGALRPGQTIELIPVSRAVAKDAYRDLTSQLQLWETRLRMGKVMEGVYG